MGMMIHDDFWAAAQAMPEKQRAPFLYALAEYRFEGREPKGTPPWLPTFIAIKDRLDLAEAKSERGRKMAQARWGKMRADDSGAQGYADAQAYAQAHAAAWKDGDGEKEEEIGVGEPPYSPPAPEPFALECLRALNEELGRDYTHIPSRCTRAIIQAKGRHTVDEVRAMVAYKRDEWRDTRYAKHLTPNTLFSPDHFEQYMAQAAEHREEESRYAAYD